MQKVGRPDCQARRSAPTGPLYLPKVSFTVWIFLIDPVYFAVGETTIRLLASTPPEIVFVTVKLMVTTPVYRAENLAR
jgi:hypothetical protein